MPTHKRIIICCDGTWQSSVSGLDNTPSNVTRLARHLAHNPENEGQEWNQIVYYDSGVGTGSIGRLQTLIQGGSGQGLTNNVIEAYNFIVLNYKPGDKIYCFGFSRGAYTARAVAGLVTDIGIIKPREMQDFPELYRQYQKNKVTAFRKSEQYHDFIKGLMFRKLKPAPTEKREIEKIMLGIRPDPDAEHLPKQETRFVEVVGVFDTVGSLGIPDLHGVDMSFLRKAYGFHNVKLSPFIKNAYHALSIDEHRGPFTPTLWYIPHETSTLSPTYVTDYATDYHKAKTKEEQVRAFKTYMGARDADYINSNPIKEVQRLYQVWFPGVHIDIGGGNDIPKDLEQIANITFCWMAELLRPHLALDMGSKELFDQEREDAKRRACLQKNYGPWYVSYLNYALEKVHLKTIPHYLKVNDVVENGWATADIEDSYTVKSKFVGSVPRHPGQCIANDEKDKKPLSELGKTWEFIHPCVQYRKHKLKVNDAHNQYDPEGLKGYNRTLIQHGSKTGRFEWVKTGGGLVWDKIAKKAVTSDKIDVKIPEWVIYRTKGDSESDDRSFERAAMTDDARQWLENEYGDKKFWKEALTV